LIAPRRNDLTYLLTYLLTDKPTNSNNSDVTLNEPICRRIDALLTAQATKPDW